MTTLINNPKRSAPTGTASERLNEYQRRFENRQGPVERLNSRKVK